MLNIIKKIFRSKKSWDKLENNYIKLIQSEYNSLTTLIMPDFKPYHYNKYRELINDYYKNYTSKLLQKVYFPYLKKYIIFTGMQQHILSNEKPYQQSE